MGIKHYQKSWNVKMFKYLFHDFKTKPKTAVKTSSVQLLKLPCN